MIRDYDWHDLRLVDICLMVQLIVNFWKSFVCAWKRHVLQLSHVMFCECAFTLLVSDSVKVFCIFLSFCLQVPSVTERVIFISALWLWICLLLCGPVKFCFIFYESLLRGICKLCIVLTSWWFEAEYYKMPLYLPYLIWIQLSFCSVWMVHLLLSSFL